MGGLSSSSSKGINDCPSRGMSFTMSFVRTAYPSVRGLQTSELARKLSDPSLTSIGELEDSAKGAAIEEEETEEKKVDTSPMELTPPPLLLDVRAEKEWEVSHLKGAIQVKSDWSAEQVEKKVREQCGYELHSGHKDVVCYCSVGWRSAGMAQTLTTAGIPQVWNLEGSIFQWANEGRPMVDGKGEETSKVHTYNSTWAVLVDDVDQRVS